jgi:hypothetical protein
MVNMTPIPTEKNALLPFSSTANTTAPPVGFTEVVFGKGNILEVIRMTGPGTQYSILKTLAETAYNKIG